MIKISYLLPTGKEDVFSVTDLLIYCSLSMLIPPTGSDGAMPKETFGETSDCLLIMSS